MRISTLLIVGLVSILLAGCPAKPENTNAANNANKTNNTAANKNTNTTSQSSAPTTEKPAANVNLGGNWESEFFNKKGESYTQLTLFIKQTGETVSGTYSVIDFVGDEPQIEDGNQTPFTGTIKDGVATIKFDVNATVPGTQENVKFVEPADGKSSTATLTMSGDKVQWKLAGGASPMEIPKNVVLIKAK